MYYLWFYVYCRFFFFFFFSFFIYLFIFILFYLFFSQLKERNYFDDANKTLSTWRRNIFTKGMKTYCQGMAGEFLVSFEGRANQNDEPNYPLALSRCVEVCWRVTLSSVFTVSYITYCEVVRTIQPIYGSICQRK
jgi:hypothetical protein